MLTQQIIEQWHASLPLGLYTIFIEESSQFLLLARQHCLSTEDSGYTETFVKFLASLTSKGMNVNPNSLATDTPLLAQTRQLYSAASSDLQSAEAQWRRCSLLLNIRVIGVVGNGTVFGVRPSVCFRTLAKLYAVNSGLGSGAFVIERNALLISSLLSIAAM